MIALARPERTGAADVRPMTVYAVHTYQLFRALRSRDLPSRALIDVDALRPELTDEVPWAKASLVSPHPQRAT